MNDQTIPAVETADNLVKQVIGHYGAPAYVRRARRVEEALETLLARCRRQGEEWLLMPRLLLGTLKQLAGDWSALRPFVADGAQVAVFSHLESVLTPQPRIHIERTDSSRRLRNGLLELNESLDRFNTRWNSFLDQVDLAPLNEQIDGYNRYYLLEKECIVRSPRAARHGFQRLEPFTRERLGELLPPLPVPILAQAMSAAPPPHPRP